MTPTRTEKRILAALAEGCFLDAGQHGGEMVEVRKSVSWRVPAVMWTTRKTVRAMVQKGLLNRDWTAATNPPTPSA